MRWIRVTDLSELSLPPRLVRLLKTQGIDSVEQLTQRCPRELLDLKAIGRRSIHMIEDTLKQRGLSLSPDPLGPYLCARHGSPTWDTTLESLFLCDKCADEFTNKAFWGQQPAYTGQTIQGYCLHCNRFLDVRMRQWFLCTVCVRVVRSIGRSIEANATFQKWWQNNVPRELNLDLQLTDPPQLEPYVSSTNRPPKADFECYGPDREILFAIEIKTGRNCINGHCGAKMTQFQLDHSDCDGILAVVRQLRVPVYLVHVQVIDRAYPPTLYYKAVGLWWTDLTKMAKCYMKSNRRGQENRTAAYYRTTMFSGMQEFLAHLKKGEHLLLRKDIQQGRVPALYDPGQS